MDYGKKLSHAYIIAAPPEAGYKKACELAAAMLCPGESRPCGICPNCLKAAKGIHPDIMTVTRLTDDKGKLRREIYVDQIREVVSSAVIMPNEADKKVYIIRDAGTMNENAQNAFLKLLEEPPSFVSFILIADNPGLLLETLRSRCVIIGVNGQEDTLPPEAGERADKYLSIAAARQPMALLQFAKQNEDMSGAEALEFLSAVKLRIADMLCSRRPDMGLSRSELMRLVELMRRGEKYLGFNVSVKHLMGLLSVRTIQSK